MESYPEELRSPPVSLVTIVGCPQHHSTFSTHLQAQQPPINTLALPHFSQLSFLFSSPNKPTPNPTPDPNPPPGFLKKDWLLKHRTKLPAVLAALFPSDHVSGDPAHWLQLCTDLDNIKSLTKPKNIKLVLVLVTSSPADDVSEDRMISLRKRAEVDSKHLVVFNSIDALQIKQSLHRLGALFAELATTYYRDEGRRIKSRVEKKSFNSPELNVRYCFKVAVYAEFRRDWGEALRFYEEAYHTLHEMIGSAKRLPVIQRLVEIKTVAEHLHFKIATLLLHGGKIIEAITWFRRHNASYKKLEGLPEATYLHWEWMTRQFLVFAELLESSSKTISGNPSVSIGAGDKSLTEWEFQPAYYYRLAAHFLTEKRTSLELAVSMSDDVDRISESVVPADYVGQFALLLEQGDTFAMQLLTDDEYMSYAIAEGKKTQSSDEIILLLRKSFESFSNLKAQRMASLCSFLMAKEYFFLGDISNAKSLLDSVASLYRREGWVILLWEALGYLRECSRKCGVVKEFIEYSLEMAALPVPDGIEVQALRSKEWGPAGPASLAQRKIIHKEVFGLLGGETGVGSVDNINLKLDSGNPLYLEIDIVSPLRSVLLASVAFHEPVIKPSASSQITLSLLSQLPVTTDIDQLEVHFNKSECNFVVTNAEKSEAPISHHSLRVESAKSLALTTNKWLRLTYSIKSEQSGKLECTYVIAKMGPITICCRAESPASMDDLPLWKFEDRMETLPTKDPALAFSGQKAAQIEEPDPQVDLVLGGVGPALVGECFTVPVTVATIGHSVFSGELKINLVDVKGGGLFSPREAEPSSMDSHHVELLGVNGEEGNESCMSPDKIEKIQQSFGLVSVPILKDGETWSCKLEIRWHRPKPVMLFVSLGYFPDSYESNSQKVHVHRSLEIEGKTAVVISHHFMQPFRQHPLLLSKIKPSPDSDPLASVPLNETSILVVTAKNSSEVPLLLKSTMSIEENEDTEKSCTLQHASQKDFGPASLAPGEEFKKVFTIIPEFESSNLKLGSVLFKWRRSSEIENGSSSAATDGWVLSKHLLPDINVELSPLVVSLECPPYGVLGDPFSYSVKMQNQTDLLQEVKFSLADAQSFVISGCHSNTVFVLPKSVHTLYYRTVPLASGLQQLPRVTVTSLRYSVEFQPSIAASTVFVFPSKPDPRLADARGEGRR